MFKSMQLAMALAFNDKGRRHGRCDVRGCLHAACRPAFRALHEDVLVSSLRPMNKATQRWRTSHNGACLSLLTMTVLSSWTDPQWVVHPVSVSSSLTTARSLLSSVLGLLSCHHGVKNKITGNRCMCTVR